MVVNLKIIFKCFVISMTLSTRSPHQEHQTIMVLLNGRIRQEMAHTLLNLYVLPKYF